MIPRWGRFPGEGKGGPLQYPRLGNSMSRGAWWATVHEVAMSWAYKDIANPCSHHVDWGGEVVSWEGMSAVVLERDHFKEMYLKLFP